MTARGAGGSLAGMRAIFVGALFLVIGCGDVTPEALDAPGGPCESRDTVSGGGDVDSVTTPPGQVNCDNTVAPEVGSLVTIDTQWRKSVTITGSTVQYYNSKNNLCKYDWSYELVENGCRWTVTVLLISAVQTP